MVLINVLWFWEPLRTLIRSSTRAGFIPPANEGLVIFVDGPAGEKSHDSFDWGKAALDAITDFVNRTLTMLASGDNSCEMIKKMKKAYWNLPI